VLGGACCYCLLTVIVITQIRNKQKARGEESERDRLRELDPELAAELDAKEARQRAEERMTLRHRYTAIMCQSCRMCRLGAIIISSVATRRHWCTYMGVHCMCACVRVV
jgi:hypothetical protein